MQRGRSVFWLCPAGLLILGLALASQLSPAESTVELLYLRPIDMRTKALILTTALCGPVLGWTLSAPFENEQRAGKARVWWATILAFIATGATLYVSGETLRLSAALGVMSAIQAATTVLLLRYFAIKRRGSIIALFVCFLFGGLALIAVFDTSFALLGVLAPTYWMGDALVAAQLGQESDSAGVVGFSLHLLPLAVALGLTDAQARSDRQ